MKYTISTNDQIVLMFLEEADIKKYRLSVSVVSKQQTKKGIVKNLIVVFNGIVFSYSLLFNEQTKRPELFNKENFNFVITDQKHNIIDEIFL